MINEKKTLIYWLILLIATYAFIEAFAYGALYYVKNTRNLTYKPVDVISNNHRHSLNKLLRGTVNYITLDSKLGWTIKENGYAPPLYQANSSGVRSSKEYGLIPPSNVLRISAFGDSFTHSDNVGNDETWEAILESFDSNLEVINFGVPGFGLDQAYLHYLSDGQRYKSHIVFIGFMSENIFRNVGTFRPFYHEKTGLPFSKPRFAIKNGRLFLIPNKLRKLDDYKLLLSCPKRTLAKIGINDYYYANRYKSSLFDFSPVIRLLKVTLSKDPKNSIISGGYYSGNSEAFRVTKKIFDAFYASVHNNNSFPIILIFPTKGDIKRNQKHKTKRYQPLLSYFVSKGYQYIDLLGAFDELGDNLDVNEQFVSGHYSPLANKLVAKYLHDYLSKIHFSDTWRVIDELSQP